MRELFDEVAGQYPLDPEEAVRRTMRRPQRKRFYTSAGVAATPDGFAVTLDGKSVRTPSGRPLLAPTSEIADGIAAEWNAQVDFINPLTMPLTRFANSIAEAVADRVDGGHRGHRELPRLGSPVFIAPRIRRRWWRGRWRCGIRCCRGRLFPKEQWLADTASAERAAGRKALLYVQFTDTKDIQPRLQQILRRAGCVR